MMLTVIECGQAEPGSAQVSPNAPDAKSVDEHSGSESELVADPEGTLASPKDQGAKSVDEQLDRRKELIDRRNAVALLNASDTIVVARITAVRDLSGRDGGMQYGCEVTRTIRGEPKVGARLWFSSPGWTGFARYVIGETALLFLSECHGCGNIDYSQARPVVYASRGKRDGIEIASLEPYLPFPVGDILEH